MLQGMSGSYKRHSLGASNVQRGRDHGLPTYCELRVWCGLDSAPARHFSNLTGVPAAVQLELAKIYYEPCDVDLFTGLVSEVAVADGVVGATAACILGEGFNTWKYGDRFFFRSREQPRPFTAAQIAQIMNKVSMTRVICDK